MTRQTTIQNHRRVKWLGIFLLLALSILIYHPNTVLAGDVIKLKDGSIIEGHIAAWSQNGSQIYFDSIDPNVQPRWIAMNDIEAIQFGDVFITHNPTETSDVKKILSERQRQTPDTKRSTKKTSK